MATQAFGIGGGTIATLAVAASNYLGQFAVLSPWLKQVVAVGLIAVMAALKGDPNSVTTEDESL